MVAYGKLWLLSLVPAVYAQDPRASTFAGETATFQYPPAGVTATNPNPNFPDASEVGFPGATPTGDEPFAIETAPAIAPIDNESPIVRPDTSDNQGSRFDVTHHWGNLSPMFSLPADTFGLPNSSPIVPAGCSIDAVHILHRHGARYPTTGAPPAAFAAKINAAANSASGFSASGPLEFLDSWTFKLGAEILTPLGRQQLYELGVTTQVRYGGLLKKATALPVWRTTSQERMVDSALQFAAGFFGVQFYQNNYYQLIEVEENGINNTLAAYDRCPNANNAIGNFGTNQSALWAAQYTAPTIKRLQSYINGVNLTAVDIIAMQELCAYESVALGFSEFCALFTESEWESFEYFIDLGFWYSNGPGNPTVAAQGIGYVEEVISRLTQTRITTFDTSVNGTIVSSNITFPFNQPIYVDASHDTSISAIAVALNLTVLAEGGPLPTDHIPQNRKWIISHITPFATNLVAQVLSCPASSTSTHIRWILNDAVVPLTGVQGCTSDPNGLCDLQTYIKGTQQRIAEVDYQHDCFANYSIPIPDTITDGRPPKN